MTKPDPSLLEKTIELEREIGAEKSSSPVYQKLTDLQWYFALLYASRVILNTAEFCKEFGFNEPTIYRWLKNSDVVTAIAKLTSAELKRKSVEIAQVLAELALSGNTKAAEIYLKHYPPQESKLPEEEQQTIAWDMSGEKWKEKEPKEPKAVN